MTRIVFVRHGETEWNRARLLQGRTDIPLNDHGRRQAAAAAQLLADRPAEAIVTSPLGRAVETGRIVAEHAGLELLGTHDDLVERDFGEAEGWLVPEARERWGHEYPGAEPDAALAARGRAAVEHLAAHHDAVIAVAHGTFIRAAVDSVTDGALDRLGNGDVVLIERVDDAWRVEVRANPIPASPEADPAEVAAVRADASARVA
ncbi:histidine phosphatase family protein [Agromyces mangrovi Wang et al. 2018]|uniref:histidine phosphatase family protein n=1 Tax=Agromyces mangrovi TaxID=1858653 RepID=UPI002572D580|nr:histidine phosphatase family protein [Agromyces mangrovi]BDZ64031.1 putative phosphatase PhoE [Agromyces mangrovi]